MSSPEAPDGGTVNQDSAAIRIRVLAIFFLGFGTFGLIGGGLHLSEYLLDNLTTYFVAGGVVFVVGLLLLAIAR